MALEKERFFKDCQATLSKIDSEINSSVDQDKITDYILEAVTEKIGFEFASIQLADD